MLWIVILLQIVSWWWDEMSPEELLELSLKLSQEKLYIQTERETIARLNQDVSAAAAQVQIHLT